MVLVHFASDLGAGRAGAGLAAVLLDHEQHAVVAGPGSQVLEAFDPQLVIAPLGVAERQHLRHLGGPGLQYALPQHLQAVLRLRIDAGEHHHRFEPHVAAARGQFPSLGRRGVGGQNRHLLAAGLFHVRSAPGDEAVAGRADAGQGPLQREARIGQGHAGDLKPRRLLGVGIRLLRRHRRRGLSLAPNKSLAARPP